MDWKNLGVILHTEYNMNMSQLAMRVDVTQVAISNLIKGKNKAKPETQKKILEALNLTEEQYAEMSAKFDKEKDGKKKEEGKEQNRNAFHIKYQDDTDDYKAKAAGMKFEDMPDKWVDKMSDAELRVTKERECRGNRCEMCQLQCAIGKELKKRGLVEMKKTGNEKEERGTGTPSVACGDSSLGEGALGTGTETPSVSCVDSSLNGGSLETETPSVSPLDGKETMETENKETEYPFWMCELLSENAEPDTVEFATAYWGAIPETVTAAQVADMKRAMMQFEQLKEEVGKLLTDVVKK